MRTCALVTALAVTLGPLAGLASAASPPAKVKPAEVCTGDYGTSVLFEESPQAAARIALKEEKLVMVLHVSGYFEDPAMT